MIDLPRVVQVLPAKVRHLGHYPSDSRLMSIQALREDFFKTSPVFPVWNTSPHLETFSFIVIRIHENGFTSAQQFRVARLLDHRVYIGLNGVPHGWIDMVSAIGLIAWI